MVWQLTIPGRVQPKQQPRSFEKRGGGIGHYTEDETKIYEQLVAPECRASGLGPVTDLPSLDTPIRATLHVHHDHAVLELEPLDGPRSKVDGDNDNLAKSVLDALNKLAYRMTDRSSSCTSSGT